MLLDDVTALRKRLLMEAAAYSDVLIELGLSWAKRDVYVLTDDVLEGFVLAARYPNGHLSVTLDARSLSAVRELFEMASDATSGGCKVTSEEIAEALAAEYGCTVRCCSDDTIHYATDHYTFRPVAYDTGAIRRLGKEEVGRIHLLAAEEEELKGESGRFEGIEERLDAEKSIVYMASQDGKDVGYIEFNEMAEYTPLWEVDLVYTTPTRRRLGIGKQLLSAATEDVLKAGLVPLYTVSASNVASRKTCESVGYYKCLDRWRLEPESA